VTNVEAFPPGPITDATEFVFFDGGRLAFVNDSKHRAVVAKYVAEANRLRKALKFYADPFTYAAIASLSDRPCGGFEDDFEEIDGVVRPGKRARAALGRSDDRSDR